MTYLSVTETSEVGTVSQCQAILVAANVSNNIACGSRGIISAQGIVPINMW